MGITEVFDQELADLHELLAHNESVSVSDAIHKAFIDISEEGTEAAAATGDYHFDCIFYCLRQFRGLI